MKVFISYAKDDRRHAETVKRLVEKAGVVVWLAPTSIQTGGSFTSQIADEICDADVVIVICSPHAAQSGWVERELAFAIANSKALLPIQVATFSSRGWLRLLVGPLDWIDARDGFETVVRDRIIQRLGRQPALGKVITTLNLKGGVGKTTLTANMGAEAFFSHNAAILYVDLDPQYNLSQFFLGEKQIEALRDAEKTVLSLFELRSAKSGDVTRFVDGAHSLLGRDQGSTQTLDLFCGHDDLFAYTIGEKDKDDEQVALANLAAFIDQSRRSYDLILLDVNPSASFITKCALSVADHVMAPVRPERFALNGLKLLERLMSRVKGRDFNADEVSIVLNQISNRVGVANQNIEEQTRNAIKASRTWARSIAPKTIPFSTTMQPSALDEAGDRPVDMVAQLNRAPALLREALSSCVTFVYGRAGVRYARRNGRGAESAAAIQEGRA